MFLDSGEDWLSSPGTNWRTWKEMRGKVHEGPQEGWIWGLVSPKIYLPSAWCRKNNLVGQCELEIIYNPKDISENLAPYEIMVKPTWPLNYFTKKRELEVIINWCLEIKSPQKYWRQSWKHMRNKEKVWDSSLQLCSTEEPHVATRLSIASELGNSEQLQNIILWLPLLFLNSDSV